MYLYPRGCKRPASSGAFSSESSGVQMNLHISVAWFLALPSHPNTYTYYEYTTTPYLSHAGSPFSQIEQDAGVSIMCWIISWLMLYTCLSISSSLFGINDGKTVRASSRVTNSYAPKWLTRHILPAATASLPNAVTSCMVVDLKHWHLLPISSILSPHLLPQSFCAWLLFMRHGGRGSLGAWWHAANPTYGSLKMPKLSLSSLSTLENLSPLSFLPLGLFHYCLFLMVPCLPFNGFHF